LRKYPQFRSTPNQVASLPSQGTVTVAQTVRRKFPGIGSTPGSVQTLLAQSSLVEGEGLPTLSAATYAPGSITTTGFRPRVTAS
jgi:hypothetical protein